MNLARDLHIWEPLKEVWHLQHNWLSSKVTSPASMELEDEEQSLEV
jgi:hypothetical protein